MKRLPILLAQFPPCCKKEKEESKVRPSPWHPEHWNATAEFVPEHYTEVRKLQSHAKWNPFTATARISSNSEKHDPEEDQDQRRELNIANVIRRRHSREPEDLKAKKEKYSAEKGIVDPTHDKQQLDPLY